MIKANQDTIPIVSNQRTKELIYKPILTSNIGEGQTLGDLITDKTKQIEVLKGEIVNLANLITSLTKEHNKLVGSYKKQVKALKAQIIELQEDKKKWKLY